MFSSDDLYLRLLTVAVFGLTVPFRVVVLPTTIVMRYLFNDRLLALLTTLIVHFVVAPLPSVALTVIVAVPTFFAVTTPLLFTVATLFLFEEYVTFLFVTEAGEAVTVSESVSPTSIILLLGLTVSLAAYSITVTTHWAV